MRRLFLAVAVSLVAAASAFAESNDSIQVRIKGMRCDDCAHKIYERLTKIKGVNDITFDLERRTATIFYDTAITNADSVQKPLVGTRYNPTPYSADEVIYRGKGFKLLDMATSADASKAMKAVEGLTGVDSLATDLVQKKLFVKYDANKIKEAELRRALKKAGFAPITYYTSARIDYAYLPVPRGKASDEKAENLLAIDAIDDATFSNDGRHVAITYDTKTTTKEQLQKDVKKILAQ